MFVLGYLILFSFMGFEAMARDLTVFAIQRNLQLSDKDPIFHDYYLDGGSEYGLRAGQIVTVERRIPLHDLTRNRPLGDMHLPVAQLKIIYVQQGPSVARLQKLYSDNNRPLIDYNAVMIGDSISTARGADDGGDSADAASPAKTEAPKPTEAAAEKSPEKPVEKAPEKTQVPTIETKKVEPTKVVEPVGATPKA
jgi:hypothetical protein